MGGGVKGERRGAYRRLQGVAESGGVGTNNKNNESDNNNNEKKSNKTATLVTGAFIPFPPPLQREKGICGQEGPCVELRDACALWSEGGASWLFDFVWACIWRHRHRVGKWKPRQTFRMAMKREQGNKKKKKLHRNGD
ncbi:hypothetical protein TcG_08646 [Trypanosoma cruzi]|nr:hypothetical protein TcG_08646 [Trypanosoma cruzi]